MLSITSGDWLTFELELDLNIYLVGKLQSRKKGCLEMGRAFEGEGVARKVNIPGFSFLLLFNFETKFVFIHSFNINNIQ